MAIKVVAFDVHDTLARWCPDRVSPIEVRALLARFGMDVSYQALEAARQGVFFIDGAQRQITCWTDFLALMFERLGLPARLDVLSEVAVLYERRETLTPYPDAAAAVSAARRAGLVVCVFTTLPRFITDDALREIDPHLEHFFNGPAVGAAKGSRAFYETIPRRLGVRGDEILCVGDDPLGDCLLPAESGWRPVLLDRRGDRKTDDPAGRFEIIGSLGELGRYWA